MTHSVPFQAVAHDLQRAAPALVPARVLELCEKYGLASGQWLWLPYGPASEPEDRRLDSDDRPHAPAARRHFRYGGRVEPRRDGLPQL